MMVVHRCGHCNRTLRDPDSMKIGYGPVCYKKIYGIPLQKTSTKTNTKKTRYVIDNSKMENLDEVFKDVT